MQKVDIQKISQEIEQFKQARDTYRKRFWLHAPKLGHKRRKEAKKLFSQIDRLRNHLTLWLLRLGKKQPAQKENELKLIDRAMQQIRQGFQKLDNVLHHA